MRNEELEALKCIGRQGATPDRIDPANIYRSDEVPNRARLRALFRDGALPVGGRAPPLPGFLPAPARLVNVVRGGVGRAPVLPVAGGPPPPAAAVQRWEAPGSVRVCVEDLDFHLRGDIILQLIDDSILRGRALMLTVNDDVIALRSMAREDTQGLINDDARVSPVRFDRSGERRRAFAESVDLTTMDEPEGGIGLPGPRSCGWLPKATRDAGTTPSGQGQRQRWLRAIADGDRSAYEHEVFAPRAESMLTIGQLNAPSLQPAGLVARRPRLMREAGMRSRSAPDCSSADHFTGWTSRKHGAIASPRWHYVATATRDEAAIAKDVRKAHEEMTLKRSGAKGGGRGANRADAELWPYVRSSPDSRSCGD